MNIYIANGRMLIKQVLYNIPLTQFYLFGMNAIKDFDTVFLGLCTSECGR